ncbi:MAG: phosphodiester glycosidase family protein [Clostridia bacterium]|nr:phosphodiester glycosidase family protein [Clostridia bacterium]
MIKITLKRIITVALAVILAAGTIPAVLGDSAPTLKETSALTIDKNGGFIRGIWGTTTAAKLIPEFSGSVHVKRGDRVLAATEPIASDDRVYSGAESYAILIYGDANRDGKVTLSDISTILMSIAKWDVDLCIAAADVSMNGKCDLSDASTLLKWIAGWDITLADSVFPKIDFPIGSGFSIVIPENADIFERKAAEYLSSAIDDIYDKNVGNNRIITDSQSAECEILIGNTSRSRTAEVKAKLDGFDRAYSIPTNGTVVITGNDSIGTYEAVRDFVWYHFGYIDEYNTVSSYSAWNGTEYTDVTTSKNITSGTSRYFEYTPNSDPLTFGGVDISEFDIVSKHPEDDATRLIHRAILRETGADLDIVKYGEEDFSPAIRLDIGKADGTEYHSLSTNVFAIGLDGDDIVIDAGMYNSMFSAAEAFVKWYVEKRLPISEGEVRYGGDGPNMLMPVNKTEAVLAEGVTYSEIKYEDRRDQPVLAYLVKVENGADRVMMGMPDNGTSVSNVKASVLDAINAAEADGIDIVAGINADFFHIESDYRPQGLCVKDGVILKGNDESRAWIAVMKDGTLDCGIAGEARRKIDSMMQGFGASHVLMKDGKEYQTDVGGSFATIRHPRTAMGYDSEGTVYLLVVDGRRPKLSNGASLLDLMLILMDEGCETAVNLDGGGSSTMIVDNGGFKVGNSPSDGALRKVFNSVLIKK